MDDHQLRLVVYPHYFQGFHTCQVVGLGISEPSTVGAEGCCRSHHPPHRYSTAAEKPEDALGPAPRAAPEQTLPFLAL